MVVNGASGYFGSATVLAELALGRQLEPLQAVVSLVASGQIPLAAVELKSYPFAQLEAGIDAAGRMSGLQCTIVEGQSPQAWG